MKKIIIYLLLSIMVIYANATIHHSNMQRFIHILKLAKQGDYIAQYELANIYRDGKGVTIDLVRAFHLYHLSALKNYPPAQYQLGMAFRHGLGVRANHELARYWIRKSARNNYKYAQEIFMAYYAKKGDRKEYPFATIARY